MLLGEGRGNERNYDDHLLLYEPRDTLSVYKNFMDSTNPGSRRDIPVARECTFSN